MDEAELNHKIWKTLRELADFEPNFLENIVGGFMQTSQQRLRQLEAGEGDTGELAHALRGAALQVGADAFAASCAALELHPDQREARLPEIRREFERAGAALASRLP